MLRVFIQVIIFYLCGEQNGLFYIFLLNVYSFWFYLDITHQTHP